MINYKNSIKDNQQRYSSVDIFSTEGRIGRQAYFVYSVLLPVALFLILASIAGMVSKLGGIATQVSYALLALSVVAVLMLLVRLTIQRCHDFNVSNGFALFAMIPFANIIFSLIPGNNGLNSYGEAPEPVSTLIKIATQILSASLIAIIAYTIIQIFGININGVFS